MAGSPYANPDLAPTPPAARTWGALDYAALWVALAACVPTYMLAASLIDGGMSWWQAVLTVLLGNLIVLVPMLLNAHAGARYGIPFPVYCRAAFGVRGANVPAVLRALVACGWFGIQTWIGGWAVYKGLEGYRPGWADLPPLPALGINAPQLACFLAFWAANVLLVWRGVGSVRLLLAVKAPLRLALGVALAAWAYWAAGGVGPILSRPSEFAAGGPKAGRFWSFFLPALTANVGFWATLALNIPDFTRYARSQRAQTVGQAVGLPLGMGLFALLGVAVTSATTVVFGRAEWDPVAVLARVDGPAVRAAGLAALALATLATNVAANAVGPANDFANLWPRRVSFRAGGVFTGLVGVAIQPWRLVADPSGFIFRWLVAYSALLGAVGGVLIADYYLIRRTRLDVAGLYRRGGPYWYRGGVNPVALVALGLGVAPCVPGFLAVVGVAEVAPVWVELYHYAWFLSFGVSFLAYAALMWPARRPGTTRAEGAGPADDAQSPLGPAFGRCQ